MGLNALFSPKNGERMRVGCFLSGSGTNAIKIIENAFRSDSNYDVKLLFSDVRDGRETRDGNKMCKALDIAETYDIDYECIDIRDCYKRQGKKNIRDLSLRPAFDRKIRKIIDPYQLNIIALAGYMSIVTKPLLDWNGGGKMVNVHPADLTKEENGRRKFVGIHAVRDAILAGEKNLKSTIHIVREKVDYGEILDLSDPVQVKLPENINLKTLRVDKDLQKIVVLEHQNRLKEKGDWIAYPRTIKNISMGHIKQLNEFNLRI